MPLEIALEKGVPHQVEVAYHGERATVTIDGRGYAASVAGSGDGYQLTFESTTVTLWTVVDGDTVWVQAFGRAWELSLVDPVQRATSRDASADLAVAPMPGTVVAVAVEAAQEVSEGQRLVVIESMKMQSEIVATRHGVVDEVFLAVGDTFERGAPLVSLRPEPEAD